MVAIHHLGFVIRVWITHKDETKFQPTGVLHSAHITSNPQEVK